MSDPILYELIGLGWSLPIMVESDCGFARVMLAAIPWLKEQRHAAATTLDSLATQREGDVWFLTPENLSKCASVSAETDAEQVVSWKRPYDELSMEASNMAEFIERFCKSVYCPAHVMTREPENMRIIWDSLCRFALDWMTLKNGTVDLGFARLNAFCARVNWKTAVIASVQATVRRENRKYRSEDVSRNEVKKLFKGPPVTAYDAKEDVFKWSLDVTPTEHFTNKVNLIEKSRTQNTRSYESQVRKFLNTDHHKHRMHSSLIHFAKEAEAKVATFHGGNETRFESQRPAERKIILDPPPQWESSPLVIGHSANDSARRTMVPKNASLLTVQDLQSLKQNVRHVGPTVDPAGEDKATTARMFMLLARKKQPGPTHTNSQLAAAELLADESPDPGCELLSLRPNGGANGLEGKPEQLSDFSGGGVA